MAGKTTKKVTPPDPASMSFEDALEELEAIMTRIEDGDISLEDSVTAYARGEALLKACRTKLNAFEQKVDALSAADLPETDDDED